MKARHFQKCQVETPPDVVALVWALAKKARHGRKFESVLDLGAGDARFARAQTAFGRYLGVEVDQRRASYAGLPRNAQIVTGDALAWNVSGYDLCIGNPPYIRHHHLDSNWQEKACERVQRESGVSLKRTANVYILFLIQALLRTHERGLVAQLVPFEWVSRPSASELRAFIKKHGWQVSVYRFNSDIFPRVLTTASVTIIDKRQRNGEWLFGEIGRNGDIRRIKMPTGSSASVLPYAGRNDAIHALRGLSPGGQDIFVLTEEERLHFSLKRQRDVVPCVTSLRNMALDDTELDMHLFAQRYVARGARCWLIRSDRENRSVELQDYLKSVGNRWNQYSTCTTRPDWARYRPHPAPTLLFSSGFVGKTPKVVVNKVGAIAVGPVYGVISKLKAGSPAKIADRLRKFAFDRRVVHHSNNLRKLEVRQLNSVLAELFA